MNNQEGTGDRDELLQRLMKAIQSPGSTVSNEEIRKILSLTETNVSEENKEQLDTSVSSEDSDDSDDSSTEDNTDGVQEKPTTSSASSGIKIYPRRPGADDMGREYELKITALFSFRCAIMNNTKEMWLGSNVDNVGDFDDIVFVKQTPDDEHFAYMVQVKHQEKPRNITQYDLDPPETTARGKKDDFSLAKYSKGFVGLMKSIDNSDENELEIVQYLRRAKRIMFVLYTNKGVNDCDCQFLENFRDDMLGWLETNKGNVYKFNHAKLSYDPKFLQQLILLTDQVHLKETDKLIRKEIKRFLTSLGITNVDFKKVSTKFVTFIRTWIKGFEDQKGTKIFYTLTKSDILYKLIDVLLDPYKLDFSKDCLFDNCPEENIWNDIISDKTITVVDYDAITFEFLKSCIGSEIGQYCNEPKKRWFDHLSKSAQKQFCQNFPDFNTRVITGQEDTTLFDVYRGLWFNNKLPLLVKIETIQDYRNIKKILKVSDNNFRTVITKNKTVELARTKTSEHFCALNDLNHEHKDKILNQPVQLQGRSSEMLRNLLDEPMYKIVKCKDIINILAKQFSVGDEYKLHNNYLIERSLSKVFLPREVFSNIKDELFLIENFEPTDGTFNNVVTSREQIKKSNKRPIHRLVRYDEQFYEWVESFGSTSNIRKFQQGHLYKIKHLRNEQYNYSFSVDKLWVPLDDKVNENKFWNTTTILSANPGTGKSILMNLIARRAPLDMWVLKINLNEHEEYYKKLKNCKASDHLTNLFEDVLTLQNCENKDLSRAVFKKFLSQKKVLILLDGFDEISVMYKAEVTEIAKSFHDEGYQMWITTRPVMKLHLEEIFNTFSIRLKPFTPSDQEQYLKKYFTAISAEWKIGISEDLKNEILRNFVEELLQAAVVNLFDYDYKFTGIPLQTQLLANVFTKDYKISLETGVVNFNKKFDLVDLYEEFTRSKIEILCDKFGKDAERTRVLFKEHQQMFSLKTAFDEKYLRELNIQEKLDQYCQDKKHEDEMQFLQREGVVVLYQTGSEAKFKFNVNFVHNTFAEYLAGKWLSENFNSEDEKIKKTVKILVGCRFKLFDCSRFIFKILDRILVKDCKSHLAVINGQWEQIDLTDVNSKDRSGRTVLQLMALEGVYHPGTHYSARGKVDDKMASLIAEIPSNQITDTKDDILGYNVLDYALASDALAVANKICEKTANLSLNIDLYVFNKDRYFTYCVVQEYPALFKILVPYFSSRDMLVHNRYKNVVMDLYCGLVEKVPKTQNYYDYVDGFGVTTPMELFKFKYKDPESPFGDYYADLRFAVSFGAVDNVNLLASQGIAVNRQDVDSNTPLHYAATHGRLNVVKILLDAGAEVNKPGKDGNTALHIAAKIGHIELVEELLIQGAGINTLNHNHNTPIHFALMRGHLTTVNLLLLNGASSNVQSKDGDTVLHYAACHGSDDIVSEILARNPETLNKQNNFGRTPLHDATRAEQCNAIRLLVDNGADCNIRDSHGRSALHYAAERDDIYIIEELLRNSIIDLQNNDEQTALHLASSKHLDTTKLLLAKGANCNVKDKRGCSPLYQAIDKGNFDVVSELLKAGASVNSVNFSNSTPLHFATMSRQHIDITKLLLAYDADVNVKNEYNVTPLHYASLTGTVEIVSELLSKGADINAVTICKFTPLQQALSRGHAETAQLLLSKGADFRTETSNGFTPLHAAATNRCTDITAYLVAEGLDVNKQTDEGYTSLHCAATRAQPDTVKLLLDNGARVNVQSIFGNTPLHLALSKVFYHDATRYALQQSTVRLLLDKGADANIENENGSTALHCACAQRFAKDEEENLLTYFYCDVVAMLLDKGADVNLKNNEGETVLDVAVRAGYERVITILKEYIQVVPPIIPAICGTSGQEPKPKKKIKKVANE